MSRYIDADLLLQTLNKNKIPYNGDVNYFIESAPTADVQEVKHGEWIMIYEYFICTNCKARFDMCSNDTYKFRHCPNCGAKMDKEVQE